MGWLNMAKYKVGDVVRLRSDLSLTGNYHPVGINSIMLNYAEEVATVVSVDPGYVTDVYKLDIDNRTWDWIDKMIEGYVIPHDSNNLYNLWDGVC